MRTITFFLFGSLTLSACDVSEGTGNDTVLEEWRITQLALWLDQPSVSLTNRQEGDRDGMPVTAFWSDFSIADGKLLVYAEPDPERRDEWVGWTSLPISPASLAAPYGRKLVPADGVGDVQDPEGNWWREELGDVPHAELAAHLVRQRVTLCSVFQIEEEIVVDGIPTLVRISWQPTELAGWLGYAPDPGPIPTFRDAVSYIKSWIPFVRYDTCPSYRDRDNCENTAFGNARTCSYGEAWVQRVNGTCKLQMRGAVGWCTCVGN
jgi:hypothetical protein